MAESDEKNVAMEKVANILITYFGDRGPMIDRKINEVNDVLQPYFAKGNLDADVYIDVECQKEPSFYNLKAADIYGDLSDRRGFLDMHTLGQGFTDKEKAKIEEAIWKAITPPEERVLPFKPTRLSSEKPAFESSLAKE